MPIIASAPTSTFAPCPEGLHQAVCVDVVDLGIVQTTYGDKHKVQIIWQVAALDATGARHQGRARYSLTLHEKSFLRRDLESWRGRKFAVGELKGFDLEKLIGVNCQIQVVHAISDEGRTWADIKAVVPAVKNAAALAARDYVRKVDGSALVEPDPTTYTADPAKIATSPTMPTAPLDLSEIPF